MFSDPAVAKIRATKSELRKALIARMSQIPWNMLGVSSQEVFSQMYVTGGSIGSILRFEAPNDYDIYLRDSDLANRIRVGFESLPSEDKEKIVKMSASYDTLDDLDTSLSQTNPVLSITINGIDQAISTAAVKPSPPIRYHLITANAVTLTNELQFITGFSGSPDSVRANFDFVHCLPWYDFANDKLYISEEQYEACCGKILIINNSQLPSKKRVDKLISKGFTYGQL